MKHRNRELTSLQKILRKMRPLLQSLYALSGHRMEKMKPRWRQLEKVRKSKWQSI